jgi:hypothetical protein
MVTVAMGGMPSHNSADPLQISAYDDILSDLGCTAVKRNELNKFADKIQAWQPRLEGNAEEKSTIVTAQTKVGGHRFLVQLTCTLSDARKGEGKKVPMLPDGSVLWSSGDATV